MSSSAQKVKPLVIRDEIHGDMTFDGTLRQVIDHQCFQRLRYIKQLGLAEYVFPCANHTRFQHSLGASYLAGQYFHSMVKSWLSTPFKFEATAGRTTVYFERTYECVRSVAEDALSREFWFQTVSMAGMLHDIGHGPWSHTFEYLMVKQDFSQITARMTGVTAEYFRDLESRQQRILHEDVSVIYIFYILNDLEQRGLIPEAMRFFLPIIGLVNKKMAVGPLRVQFEAELLQGLARAGVAGGLDFHWLLRPIISGPFDVDRIDYIQRDGRNSGVSIGGIEWRRIVSKVIPCLANHESDNHEPREVILISKIKNQHVLDDFIFSLFQMYAQVYMHPKIVGLEEAIKRLLEDSLKPEHPLIIDFAVHRQLSDEGFRNLLVNDFGLHGVDSILLRRPETSFKVVAYPKNSGLEQELKAQHFSLVDIVDRPMMKDRVGVFLYNFYKDHTQANPKNYFLRSWELVSQVAEQFGSINYSPNIWIKKDD